jgi:hypothetical protein
MVSTQSDNVLESIEYVQPVSHADQRILQRFCEKSNEGFSHGNNPIYYQTACRRLWLRFYDGETFISITTRFQGRHPFVLVKPLGARTAEKCLHLAEQLFSLTGEKVIVKNISEQEYCKLRVLGFSNYTPDDGWDSVARYDDQTYPEIVIRTGDLVNKKGRSYRSLRRDVRSGLESGLTLELCDPSQHRAEMENVIKTWRFSFLARHPTEEEQNLVHFYDYFIETRETVVTRREMLTWLCRSKGNPIGFTCGVSKSAHALDLYANPCLPEQRNAPATMLCMVLEHAHALGYEFVNLGGSETIGLHRFKRKFSPFKELERFHAVYYGPSLSPLENN